MVATQRLAPPVLKTAFGRNGPLDMKTILVWKLWIRMIVLTSLPRFQPGNKIKMFALHTLYIKQTFEKKKVDASYDIEKHTLQKYQFRMHS